MATHESNTPTSAEKNITNDNHAHGAVNGGQHQQHNEEYQGYGHGRGPGYGPGGYAGATGGALQPGLWKPYEHRRFANPAPLGLSAFALTTFVLSCCNMHARGVAAPNIAVPLAFGYGGLVQLLAGMW